MNTNTHTHTHTHTHTIPFTLPCIHTQTHTQLETKALIYLYICMSAETTTHTHTQTHTLSSKKPVLRCPGGGPVYWTVWSSEGEPASSDWGRRRQLPAAVCDRPLPSDVLSKHLIKSNKTKIFLFHLSLAQVPWKVCQALLTRKLIEKIPRRQPKQSWFNPLVITVLCSGVPSIQLSN